MEKVQTDGPVLRRNIPCYLTDEKHYQYFTAPEQYRQPPEADGRKSLQSELKGRAEPTKRQRAGQILAFLDGYTGGAV